MYHADDIGRNKAVDSNKTREFMANHCTRIGLSAGSYTQINGINHYCAYL